MYEQVEKPKENKSRANANAVAQKKSNTKQSFGFVDNRPAALQLKNMRDQTAVAPNTLDFPIAQLKQAEIDVVQDDMIGRDGRVTNTIFQQDTITWLGGLYSESIEQSLGKKVEKKDRTGQMYIDAKPIYTEKVSTALGSNRDNVRYKKLLGDTLSSMNSRALLQWLTTNATTSDECMYLHMGDRIEGGIDNGVTTFHPTLLGNDPDAKGAGTLIFDAGNKSLNVTNESGHFKPDGVHADTLNKFGEILGRDVSVNGNLRVEEEVQLPDADLERVDSTSSQYDETSQGSINSRFSMGEMSERDLVDFDDFEEAPAPRRGKNKFMPTKARTRKTVMGVGTTRSGLTYNVDWP